MPKIDVLIAPTTDYTPSTWAGEVAAYIGERRLWSMEALGIPESNTCKTSQS
jgi:hypothetical protein